MFNVQEVGSNQTCRTQSCITRSYGCGNYPEQSQYTTNITEPSFSNYIHYLSRFIGRIRKTCNKLLQSINATLDKIIEKGEPEALASVGDRLSKLAAVVEKLDRKANVVDVIEVFMAFNDWLLRRMETDRELTPDIIRTINGYQDRYVSGMVNQHI